MDYAYGYCGMPCALCTRYRTDGASRCVGCSHDGYYTDVCKVFRCARERGLRHCGECSDFPCARLGKMGDFRDLNTGGVKQRTCAFVSGRGFDEWYKEYSERAELLTEALARYNNGRMKRFLCELFIRRDVGFLREIMKRAKEISGEPKEAGAAFKELVKALDEEAASGVALREFEDGDKELLERWLRAPHVERWYQDPSDWLAEVEGRNGEYAWLRHFIAELDGKPVGFCQYYEYRLGGETWHGGIDIEGAYSIDYMIGEPEYLGRGLGRAIVTALISKIRPLENARRIIVQPEAENLPSCGVLRSCGFRFDEKNVAYILLDFDTAK